MFNSKEYWNERYNQGGNSGSGSYNNLSIFKADIINSFITNNNIQSIIDYGVGDGNQLKLIHTENKVYTGIDVSPTIISKCKEIFKDDSNKCFMNIDNLDSSVKGELVLSCDVTYHLIEDDVFHEYMKNLFDMSTRYVIIYSNDNDINHAAHVKFRKFTTYIKQHFQEWKLIQHIPNKYPQKILGFNNDTTSPSDFYIYEHDKSCNKIVHRETKLLGEPANILRLPYIEELLNKLDLPPKTKILDFGGNNFNEYCQKKQFIYEMIDLETQQTNGTGGYFGGGLTYDGINIPLGNNSYDVIIVSFVLHHTSSNCIQLLKQLKNITRKYLIICEDLCSIEHPLPWHVRCFNHQNEGIFRSDEEWKFIFEALNLKLLDVLNIRCDRDKEFSDPYKHIYRIQYLLEKNESPLPYQPINVPVYISLTSIFQNQDILLQTLQSVTSQTTTPDKIYLYLSEEPYLLDAGFENKIITNNQLLTFLKTNNTLIEINWVKNTGPYRKLLPLLKDKWNEDCIIITIDDDTIYSDNLITNLVNDYDKQQCVIGYRGFTPKLDKFEDFDYNQRNELQNYSLYNFVTGKGSILYKPQFFHQTNNLIFNEQIYLNTCDKQDDIWFYIIRIMNNISCFIREVDWLKEDITSYGLYSYFNAYNNNNTKAFQNTIQKINQSLTI